MASGWGATFEILSWNGDGLKAKYRTVLAWGMGDTSYDMQQVAKELVHVESGRLQGSITVSLPGAAPFVNQHEDPVDLGLSREDCRTLALQELDLEVSANTPYAHREEVTRGHAFLVPGFDAGMAEVNTNLRAAAAEYGDIGGGEVE